MSSTKRDWRAESKVSSMTSSSSTSSSSSTTTTSTTSSSFKSSKQVKQEQQVISSSSQQVTSSSSSSATATKKVVSNGTAASITSSSSKKESEQKTLLQIPSSSSSAAVNGTKEALIEKARSESPPPLECAEEAKNKNKTSSKKSSSNRSKKHKRRSDNKDTKEGGESVRTAGARRIIKSHIDRDKVAKKFNKVSPEDMGTSMCHMCGKQVFQMEQVKAERAVWHRSCFRCKECQKQLNVDTYQSHEGELYCKPHFKQLFQPKVVLDEPEPTPQRRLHRKNEMIICESQPVALPDDVVRCSDKPDYGLEELTQTADVRSKFKAFESMSISQDHEKTEVSSVSVKRSASILKQIARFQDGEEDLEGSEEESGLEEEDEEGEEEGDPEQNGVNKRETRKKKEIMLEDQQQQKSDQVNDMKSKWEGTKMGRKEICAEKRREEQIRVRQLMLRGKNESTKAMYQSLIEQQTETQNKRSSVVIDLETSAKLLKDRFEKGEALENLEDKDKAVLDLEIFTAADTAKGARNLFRKIDETVGKSSDQMTSLSRSKSNAEKRWSVSINGNVPKPDAEIVRSSDIPAESGQIAVDTHDIASRFKFFETYKEPEKQRREFRFTPPREGQLLEDENEQPEPEQPVNEQPVNIARSDTARKMLSKFRELEEKSIKEQEYESGSKPALKRFTPPPEGFIDEEEYSDYSGSEYDDEEGSSGEDYEDEEECEDEALREAMRARRAQSLREKFEQWDDVARKNQMNTVLLQESETLPSLDTTKNLRAKFESLHVSDQKPRDRPKTKVNRFV